MCDAPIGHRAIGVLPQHSLERPARDQEPVRMDHRDAALELGLHFGIAGGGETQLAELLVLLWPKALQFNAAAIPATNIRRFGFMGPSRRVRSLRSPQWAKPDFVRCPPMASIAAIKGQEFGTFRLGSFGDITAAIYPRMGRGCFVSVGRWIAICPLLTGSNRACPPPRGKLHTGRRPE